MELDLTKQSDVVSLMQSSKSEAEWNANCDKVKSANGGDYPSFWFVAINLSGVMSSTSSKWVG
mgnify:CR=1 FL=1